MVAPKARPFVSRRGALLWFCWLVLLAWTPDIDYVIPAWSLYQNSGLRITHTFASSLLLPCLTGMAVSLSGFRGKRLQVCLWQGAIAGLSHTIMDFWGGVIGLPLFWPFNETVFTAPIGLLPSAGSPHWQNYYFYSNLLIELGIVVPLIIIFLRNLPLQIKILRLWQSTVLLGIAIFFLRWSIGLSR